MQHTTFKQFFATINKHHPMKKHLLLFVFAFLASSASFGQERELYSVMHHEKPGYYTTLFNTMLQRDGNLVINNYIFEDTGNPDMPIPLGNLFYKISPETNTITDSLFVADTVRRPFLLARDPCGEGNVKAVFMYHEECDSTFLHISHFPDNDLHTNPDEDIVAPVCEGKADGEFGSFIDCHGHLIMKYFKERQGGIYDSYIVRFDCEGTMLDHTLAFENSDLIVRPFGLLRESPLQYYQTGPASNDLYTNLSVVVFDSLFHKNTVVLNSTLNEETIIIDSVICTRYEYLIINYQNIVIPVGGDDVLVAAEYVNDTNHHPMHAENGVAVAKYDLRTMRLKDYVVFNDYHGYYDTGQCMGLKKLSDGTVYFVYREHPDPEESVTVVKMDTDLSVEWKRLCKTEDIKIFAPFELSIIYDDNQGTEKGIAWSGYAVRTGNNNQLGIAHFFLNHDGTVGTNEAGVEVRPYLYYPNPAQDQLHLQYSPDVQPKLVELYDLQGRLVRSQSNALESLNLQGLATGQYVMKVTMEDGTAYSDKVVKE